MWVSASARARACSCRWAGESSKSIRVLRDAVRPWPTPVRLSRLPVINAVRPHVGRRGEAVGHVVEGGDRGDVPDVTIAEADAAQRGAVLLLDLPRLDRQLDRKIEHRALALG